MFLKNQMRSMDTNLYEVIITDEAEKDLDEIYVYIEIKLIEDKVAKELMTQIRQGILNLANIPYAYPEVYTKPKHEKYRKLVIKNYIILYQVEEQNKHVVIYRIEYSKKDYLYFK